MPARTYWDPVGYSEDRANDFYEEIQSYGEVPIVIEVTIGGDVYRQRAYLSQMLENGYRDTTNRAIKDAVRRIKIN
ncbi:MAG: hypothetical protein K2V38_14295 [Gemmataceae bacterium]|nr:hypothetical protein [Gemmataceae bacterium]